VQNPTSEPRLQQGHNNARGKGCRPRQSRFPSNFPRHRKTAPAPAFQQHLRRDLARALNNASDRRTLCGRTPIKKPPTEAQTAQCTKYMAIELQPRAGRCMTYEAGIGGDGLLTPPFGPRYEAALARDCLATSAQARRHNDPHQKPIDAKQVWLRSRSFSKEIARSPDGHSQPRTSPDNPWAACIGSVVLPTPVYAPRLPVGQRRGRGRSGCSQGLTTD